MASMAQWCRWRRGVEDFAAVIDGARRAGFARRERHRAAQGGGLRAGAQRGRGRAKAAGAANLLIFREDGNIEGRNTDALGLAESCGKIHRRR